MVDIQPDGPGRFPVKNKAMAKFYVYRIVNHNGHKQYKRTKCCDYWTDAKSVCWQFSKQGAKKIVETYNSYNRSNYYTYGFEPVE